MKKKFYSWVEETRVKLICVEAEDETEAEELIMEKYNNGYFNMDNAVPYIVLLAMTDDHDNLDRADGWTEHWLDTRYKNVPEENLS